MDFMHDNLGDGRQYRLFNVLDDFNREGLGIEADLSLPSARVIRSLEQIIEWRGKPKAIRCDGPEFVSREILKWLTQANIDTVHIDPGKPWQNANNESFNGKFRDECLSMEWLRNRIDAKIVIEQFRRQYNEVRPHSSLGQLTPAEFKQKLSTTNHLELAIS